MAGLSYSSLNTLLHHWLIEKKVFVQAVKSDPVLNALYASFRKGIGIGQTDIVKLEMGTSHQTMAIAEAGSFQTYDTAGSPVVVDSSTIPNKTIVSRLTMTGAQKRALEKAPEKINGATLSDVTKGFVDTLKLNMLRMAVNDGTGYLCHVYNASSSTTLTPRKSDDSTNLPEDSWVWNYIYPGMYTDTVTYSTGVNITSGDNNAISSCAPNTPAIVLDTAVDASAGGIMLRYYTGLTTTGTSGTTALSVEPDGLSGMIYIGGTHNSGATVNYLGKSASTYPRWTSYRVNAASETLNVKMLDQAIYWSKGTPTDVIVSPMAMSQFRYEADAMKKLAVRDDASIGQPALYYAGPRGWVKIIDPYLLGYSGRCYVIDSSTFRTKGTVLEPTMLRGKLELLQTADVWFDDALFEFQNICVQRNANGYIYGLKEAW